MVSYGFTLQARLAEKAMEGDFQVGPWRVQPRLNSISTQTLERRIEPKVMEVLVYLADRAGDVVPKEELIHALWPEVFVTDDVLLRCISELRKALDDDAREPRFIRTIPKRGYCLVAEVRRHEPSAMPAEAGRSDHGPGPRPWRKVWIGLSAVAVVAAVALAAYLLVRRTSPPQSRGMLAVLPFQNLSADPDQEYFSDGLTEEMITELSRIEPARLGVIARTSVMQYKGTTKGTGQIGRELNVGYLLEGSVRREGRRVRVTAQLIQASDETHLWASTYDRDLTGILAVQREVVSAIAAQIHIKLGSGDSGSFAGGRPVNPEAYIAQSLGRHHFNKLTREGLIKATENLQRAVQLEPDYAPGWLWLGNAYRFRGTWLGDMPPNQAMPLAKEALSRALKLDPSSGDALALLGWIRFTYDRSWTEAEEEIRRSIALSPNSDVPHSVYCSFLRAMRRHPEALASAQRTLELDPLGPIPLSDASVTYRALKQPDKAEQFALRLLELHPDTPLTYWTLGSLYLNTGRESKAIQTLEAASLAGRLDMQGRGMLGRLYARAGRMSDARRVLDSMLQPSPTAGQTLIGVLYFYLGEPEKALEWLEKGYRERDLLMVWLRSWADGPASSSDPRFQDLLRRMKFPQ